MIVIATRPPRVTRMGEKNLTHEQKRQKKLDQEQRRKERDAYASLCRRTPLTLQKHGYTLREIAVMKGMDLDEVKRVLYYERFK
jgi:hypothetical protein